MKKWGTFYKEFKINKGFLSSQFYAIYFLKRFIFTLSQIFLNSITALQSSLNLFCAFVSFVYFCYFRPFRDPLIQASNFLSEICALGVQSAVIFLIFDIGEKAIEIIEQTTIWIVLICLGGQMIISIFLAAGTFYKAWKKIEKIRALSFINAFQSDKKTNSAITN